MSLPLSSPPTETSTPAGAWPAVYATSLCSFILVASEFMPVSLLTPIATAFAVSEGQIGQAIAASGALAVLTSLLISPVTAKFDRKYVLLSLTALMLVSALIVALASNYATLLLGRALLGIAIGGCWSMSTATAMRLVPPESISRALAIVGAGSALATTVAAPLGSFLGDVVGWRGAFLVMVPLAALTLCWQALTLPSMPNLSLSGSWNVFRLLARRKILFGMSAILLLFMGQFSLFTYLRPYLETVTGVDVNTLSLVLLGIGVAGLIGTFLVGPLLTEKLYVVVAVIPLLMSGMAVSLIVFGHWLAASVFLLCAWGLVSTPAPVGWGTWLSRVLPQDAEAGGGLMVATIQLAITLGALFGGLIFDVAGYRTTFAASAGLLLLSAVLAVLTARVGRAG